MQFYIFVMLLGLPDNIHEEKPSFLQLKKTRYGRTDGPTDGQTDGQTLLQRCEDASKNGHYEKTKCKVETHLSRFRLRMNLPAKDPDFRRKSAATRKARMEDGWGWG